MNGYFLLVVPAHLTNDFVDISTELRDLFYIPFATADVPDYGKTLQRLFFLAATIDHVQKSPQPLSSFDKAFIALYGSRRKSNHLPKPSNKEIEKVKRNLFPEWIWSLNGIVHSIFLFYILISIPYSYFIITKIYYSLQYYLWCP